jgi:hypothetical protein
MLRNVRTTIEIPEELRKKCILIALERNLSGFSEVIIEALDSYFRTNDFKRTEILSDQRGSLSEKEAIKYKKEIKKSRANWKQR